MGNDFRTLRQRIGCKYIQDEDHLRHTRSRECIYGVMGVDEASELWELSPGYIKNLCAKGKIKSKKIGKTWIIDKEQPNPKK